jgi:hypothetical protein
LLLGLLRRGFGKWGRWLLMRRSRLGGLLRLLRRVLSLRRLP